MFSASSLPIFSICLNCNIKFEKNQVRFKKCRRCNNPFCYDCGICERRYKSLYKLIKHIKFDCNKEPAYRCDKCDFKTSRANYLQSHIDRLHTEVRPQDYHACNKCGKKYKRANDKMIHEKNCGVDPHIKCDHCDYKTHNNRNLRFHMVKKHIVVLSDYKCEKCDKMFRLRLHLVHHMEKMHSEDRKVQLACAHCRWYKTHVKSRLINHIFKNHS